MKKSQPDIGKALRSYYLAINELSMLFHIIQNGEHNEIPWCIKCVEYSDIKNFFHVYINDFRGAFFIYTSKLQEHKSRFVGWDDNANISIKIKFTTHEEHNLLKNILRMYILNNKIIVKFGGGVSWSTKSPRF